MVVEAEDKEEARRILPPLLRMQAKIVALNTFSLEEIDEILRHHRPQAASVDADARRLRGMRAGLLLGFAVNEVVHHDDVSGGRSRDAIPARDPHQEDALAGIEPYPQEREAPATRGPWQNIPAEEQSPLTSKYSIFVLSSRLTSVKTDAKPVDRRPRGAARHEEECLHDVAVQSGEEPLGAEGTEELREDGVDVAKTDRGIRRVIAIGAHLEAGPRA